MPRPRPATSVYGGKSGDAWYRYQGVKQKNGIKGMPFEFRIVDMGWNPDADAEQERLTSHERTACQDWDYTLTYKYDVPTIQGPKILKGHVHYKDDGSGKYEAKPGNFWVDGVKHCEGRTPQPVVNKFPDLKSLDDWKTLSEFQATGLEAIAANATTIFNDKNESKK